MPLIERNNNSIFKQYFPVIVTFVLIVSLATFEMFKIGNATDYEIKNSFEGVVSSKYISKSWVYVGLEDKNNTQQIKNGYNYAYKNSELINFVQIGDKVRKNTCSDTVYIIRGEQEYHFIQLAYWYNDESKDEEYKKKYMAKRLMRLYQEGCDVDSLALEFAINYLKKEKK